MGDLVEVTPPTLLLAGTFFYRSWFICAMSRTLLSLSIVSSTFSDLVGVTAADWLVVAPPDTRNMLTGVTGYESREAVCYCSYLSTDVFC